MNAKACPHCGETKFIEKRTGTRDIICPWCGGEKGYWYEAGVEHRRVWGSCPTCHGKGTVTPTEEVDLRDGKLVDPANSLEKQYELSNKRTAAGGCLVIFIFAGIVSLIFVLIASIVLFQSILT